MPRVLVQQGYLMILHKNLKMSECEAIATEVFVAGSDKTLCELCNISFTKQKNLNQHLRKIHQLKVIVRGNITCTLCNEKFHTMTLLHEHLQNQHSIALKFINETFYTENDFLDWKDKIEKESLSSFSLRNKSKGFSYYNCHRSGHHEMKQKRIRRVKTSGSIKTGSTCPAFMKASSETIDGISEIKVHYQSVHLGHDFDARTLRLKRKERENVAACLKLGIPIDRVLEEARQNVSPTNRFSHLTRKHLHNILRDYGIPSCTEKPKKTSCLQNADVEMSDSSNVCEDSVETDANNDAEIQEHEKNSAVSSLLLLQNHIYSEESINRKIQTINKLKELLSRVEGWDSQCPFPDVEDHIKAIHAHLDFSASSDRALSVQEMTPIFALSLPIKPTAKGRKITKNSSKKNKLN